MKRIGIYAGSFDPPTRGHLWMMQQGAALFDELIVVLAVNPDKPGFLTAEERVRALRALTARIASTRISAMAMMATCGLIR